MCLQSTQQQRTMRTRTHWTYVLLLAVWLGGSLFSVGCVTMVLLLQDGFDACYFHFVRHQAATISDLVAFHRELFYL